MQKLKYLAVYILPLSVYISFTSTGWLTWLPAILFYGVLPIVDILLPLDTANFEDKIAADLKNEKLYDWMLYLVVPIQLFFLVYFLMTIQHTSFGTIEFFGRLNAMGMMCGILGINVGHELGHRSNRLEQFLGEVLLLTSLNTHFLPYHNAGHHLHVATPKDPATAAKGELLYTFWFTSHFGSYFQAWQIENNARKRQNKPVISLHNRMVSYSIISILLLGIIYYFFGFFTLLSFIAAASIGIGLLETINYIEHYGLLREKNERGKYEPVRHHHSWNSDHIMSRAVLFNLSRHSDHHYNGSKKYQILKSMPTSPQMPTGYSGMVMLAFFQPLWFAVMDRKLEAIQEGKL